VSEVEVEVYVFEAAWNALASRNEQRKSKNKNGAHVTEMCQEKKRKKKKKKLQFNFNYAKKGGNEIITIKTEAQNTSSTSICIFSHS